MTIRFMRALPGTPVGGFFPPGLPSAIRGQPHMAEHQTHPNLHRSRSNGGRPQREGTNFGVFVPIWLVLPKREATNSGMLDLCHSTRSNGAVQIRVGLELAFLQPPTAKIGFRPALCGGYGMMACLEWPSSRVRKI